MSSSSPPTTTTTMVPPQSPRSAAIASAEADYKAALAALPKLQHVLGKELHELRNTHPDLVSDSKLVRFLSSQGGNVEDAAKAFREHLAWRQEVNADGIREGVANKPFLLESAPHFNTLKEAGFSFACIHAGRSRMNDIVHLEIVGQGATAEAMQKISPEQLMEHYTGYFELRSLILEADSTPDRLVKTLQIRDLSKFSLSLIAEREALSVVGKVINAGATNYPESTRYALFTQTPSFFATAWSLMQGFLPERTKKKVRFLSTPSHEELLKYVSPTVCVVLQRMSQGESGDELAKSFPPPPLHSFEAEVSAGTAEYVYVALERGRVENVSFLVTRGGQPITLNEDEVQIFWIDDSQLKNIPPEKVTVHHASGLKSGNNNNGGGGGQQQSVTLPSNVSEMLVALKLDNSGSWWSAESFKVVFVY